MLLWLLLFELLVALIMIGRAHEIIDIVVVAVAVDRNSLSMVSIDVDGCKLQWV